MQLRYALVAGILMLAPAAASAQVRAPGLSLQQGNAHDDLHSRLEREHQEWHFAHDRGPRDGNWNREHERLHQRIEQKHEQWHRAHGNRHDEPRPERDRDRGNGKGKGKKN